MFQAREEEKWALAGRPRVGLSARAGVSCAPGFPVVLRGPGSLALNLPLHSGELRYLPTAPSLG